MKIPGIILFITLLLHTCHLGASIPAEKEFPRLTFGIEGSYAATVMSYRHTNFVSNYGYRIDRRVLSGQYHSNGEILLHLGCNISRHVNLSLYSGYSGVCKKGRIYPLSIRCTWFPASCSAKDRWFAFIDTGPALRKRGKESSLAGTAKLGGGYRLSITREVKLDLIVTLRQSFLKDLYQQSGMQETDYIDISRLRRNNAAYMAVTVGIGLSF